MSTEAIRGLLASAFITAAGSYLAGPDHSVAYLIMVWASSVLVLQLQRRAGYRWWTWGPLILALALGVYVVVWTVGSTRGGPVCAALVYVGFASGMIFTGLALLRETRFRRYALRALEIVLACLLTPFLALVGLSNICTRIDNPNILRALVRMDLILGPLCGFALCLFVQARLKGRYRRIALWVYPLMALLISVAYLLWHFNQVVVRGGDPIEMLFRDG
jgi:hypothetical protein